jgi:hypothetical protein
MGRIFNWRQLINIDTVHEQVQAFKISFTFCIDWISVPDQDPHPDPDPYDPCVFGSPGSASGSVSHKHGSGSESFPFLFERTEIMVSK